MSFSKAEYFKFVQNDKVLNPLTIYGSNFHYIRNRFQIATRDSPTLKTLAEIDFSRYN